MTTSASPRQTGPDPFTLEIIKGALIAISDEMFIVLQKTAMSTVIYETLDYACGLTDARAQLISQGNGVTGFLGCLTYAVEDVRQKFGTRDEIYPGDIFITNEPYGGGGTHLSDVTLIAPVFEDERLIAFAANKGHWNELGGKDPGSWTTDATEIYQEGLQFPCVKLFRRGEANQAVIDMLAANVRTPEMTLGDMWACIAALRIGEQRFVDLVRKYGEQTVREGIEKLLDDSEALTRQELASLPHGVFEADDYIDDDGIGNGPFRVCVRVTIRPDTIICDFTGTHPQVPGPVNSGRSGLYSGVRSIFKALTSPSIPVNEGCFRPLEVICPPRSIFTAERPAPVSTYWETMEYVTDLVWKALAPVLPNRERLSAGHFLSVCGVVVSGIHPRTGDLFILVEPQAGGWGAGATKDGENALVCVGDGETYVVPAEIAETRYGFRVTQYALHDDEAGAGEFRGGLGLVRDYEIVGEEVFLTATFGRHKFRPWSMSGGQGGSTNRVVIMRADGTEEVYGKVARCRLRRGDVARLVTATGGGYGDPLRRPPARVVEDVRDGYVSLRTARETYGVTLDPVTLHLESLDARRSPAGPQADADADADASFGSTR